MALPLECCHVRLGCGAATREETIRAIGQIMLEAGEVTTRYVEGMLEKERQFSTWITEDVALPHGTNAAKREVLGNSVVLVQLPEGVDWGGKVVHLAIGFAGKGDDQHLELLSALASVLQRPENIVRLRQAKEEAEVLGILAAGEEEAE